MIDKTEFNANYGDQIDFDFCTGTVKNSLFNYMQSNKKYRSHGAYITVTTIYEVLNTVKDFGVTYFLRHLAYDIELIQVLKKAIPFRWKELFTLACYFVTADKPIMYCEDWISENECPDIGVMPSQRISKLLTGFGYSERRLFYK